MSDDSNPATPPPTEAQAAPATQPAPTITPEIQAMIDRARREAYDSGAASVRRAMQGRQTPPAPQPPRAEEPTQAPASDDVLAVLRLRDEFDDATAEVKLTAAQRRALREQVMSRRPADVAGFVREFVDVWQPAPTAPPAPPPAPSPSTPPQAPAPTAPLAFAPMPGAPPAATVVTTDTPLAVLAKLDPERVAAMAKADPVGFSKRLHDEARGMRVRWRS